MAGQADELVTDLRAFILAERKMRQRVLTPPRRDKAVAEADEALRNLTRLSALAGGHERVFISADVEAAAERALVFPQAALEAFADRYGADAHQDFHKTCLWFAHRIVAELNKEPERLPAPAQPGLFDGGDQ